MNDSFRFTDEEWRSHLAFVEQRMKELRQQEVDSRSLCGQLDGGCGALAAQRRARRRQLLGSVGGAGTAGAPGRQSVLAGR